MARRVGLAVWLLLALGSVPTGQQGSLEPPESAVPGGVFRVDVNAVEVDTLVTDAAGNPVLDLTAEDFEVLEDGRPQTIAAFRLVEIPASPTARPTFAGRILESDVQSNTADIGRLFVFVLDGVGFAQAPRTREFLRRFVEEHFDPSTDLGAVSLLGPTANQGVSPTGNPRLLLEAFAEFSGGFSLAQAQAPPSIDRPPSAKLPPSEAPNAEALVAVRVTMADLAKLVESVAAIRGRRKIIVIFSEGWAPSVPQELNIDRLVNYQGGALTVSETRAHRAITAATRGNVTIYAIDPRGAQPDPGGSLGELSSREPPDTLAAATGRHVARHNLEALAEVTGGFALVDSNSIEQALDRIVRENRSYYVLGFTSNNDRRRGRFRRVEVRVARPGLQVRARAGYVEPLGRDAAPDAQQPATPLSDAARAALESPIPVPGIPMQAATAPYYDPVERETRVSAVVELDASRLALLEQDGLFVGGVEVAYASTDQRDQIGAQQFRIADLELPRDAYQQLVEQGLRVFLDVALPPGRHQLRIAAGDRMSRAGSVVLDVEVPDFAAAPVALGRIALASERLADTTIFRGDQGPGGPVPASLTSTRAFSAGDRITVFAELYENVRASASHAVTALVQLLSDDGVPVLMTRDERPSTAVAGRTEAHGFTLDLPLDGVPPGRYVVHLEGRSDGMPSATVQRDIPIAVR